MAIFKCKMCGGDLNFEEGATVVNCEYCGTKQTVPTIDDEKKITLFARANRLRFACEFDKAFGVYESIVADFPEEAEAYWGLVLCKYGIEYVDAPATGKKIPTCHRSSFESVMEDDNFEQVLENADPIARSVYREEAKQIEELRRGIIEVSNKEEPYDIFICYKETAENGERTIDSVIAQDVYNELTEKGYRVFFSRITLEDKLGQEYEPYIFAALNSAKIMLTFGTDYEYYNAVWVKNEWSRFLQLIAKGEKKTLIPCYKNIDAYDMPKEFAKLQAQDMGRVGAMQDLLRGIEKLLPKSKDTLAQSEKEPVIVQQTAQFATVDSLLKRAFMYLEDGDWKNAADYCNRVLDISPENAEAYVGLLMAELQVRKEEELASWDASFSQNRYFMKAVNFSTEERRMVLEGYNNVVERFLAEQKEQQCMAEERNRREKRQQEEEHCRLLTEKRKSLKKKKCLMDVGSHTIVGVKSDGTVLLEEKSYGGYKVKGGKWKNIIAVAASDQHLVGLKSDGTVVDTTTFFDGNSNKTGVWHRAKWREIVAISIDKYENKLIVGLKSDGTVVVSELIESNNTRKGLDEVQNEVSQWTDIVAVATACYFNYGIYEPYVVGLKSNGTLMITSGYLQEYYESKEVLEWRNIVDVAVFRDTIIGLKSDGTLVATGSVDKEVLSWKDIIAVTIFASHVAGLKSDGTLVTTGWVEEVFDWRNIIAIANHGCVLAGLKSDGSVIQTSGKNCFKILDWNLFG